MMLVICAWHKKYFPETPDKVIHPGPDKPVSHGMCKDCLTCFKEEISGTVSGKPHPPKESTNA